MHRAGIIFVLQALCFEGFIRPVDLLGKDKMELRMGSILTPRTADGQFVIPVNETEEDDSTPQVTWKNEAGCGVVTAIAGRFFPRIVGGQDAIQGEWPWIAMIQRYYDRYDKFSFVCGGSLIKKQWVLTAGHCFFGGSASYTHVVLGAHRKDLSDSTAKRFAVARYHCHHLFIGPSNAYKDDACLIKLAGEVSYSDYIKPICLPTATQTTSIGEECEIAGWGETQGTGNNKILQQAHIRILNQTKCDEWYMRYDVTLPKDHFCAGYKKGKVDSCQGDSGGPLTCHRTEKKKTTNVLFGITSFGIGCAQKELPGVYTKTAEYTGWIASKIAKYSEPERCFESSHLLSCGSTIRSSSTTIRTPIVDTSTWMYPPNSDCSWNIEAPPGYKIVLTFECFFHVEINPNNSTECYDYMKIQSNDPDILSIYCGSVLLYPVNIDSNKASISFRSDSSVESSGFVVKILFHRYSKGVVEEPTFNETFVNENTTTSNGTTVEEQTEYVTANETDNDVDNDNNNNNQVSTNKDGKDDGNSAKSLSISSLIWASCISPVIFGMLT